MKAMQTATLNGDTVHALSSVITADEFLDLLTETTEEYQLAPGKHAVIRSLTYAEVKHLVRDNAGKKDEMELAALVVGTVHPKLTREHVEALSKAGRAGILFNMAKRIMVISGMMDDDRSMGEDGASS